MGGRVLTPLPTRGGVSLTQRAQIGSLSWCPGVGPLIQEEATQPA